MTRYSKGHYARLAYRKKVEEEILRSQPLSAHLQRLAEDAAQHAAALARVEAYATGEYAASIEAGAGVRDGRPVGRIAAGDWKAGWIEFGTRRQRPRAILRRGVEAIGLEYRSKR